MEYVLGRKLSDPGTKQYELDQELFFHELDSIGPQGRFELFQAHLFPSRTHKLYDDLAQLLRLGFIHVVLTTNYDCCVENALARAAMAAETYQVFELGRHNCTPEYAELLAENLNSWEPPVKIVKLHGSLNTRNMAWKETELRRVYKFLKDNPNTLARILRGPLIVVGQSLRDLTVVQLLEDASGLVGAGVQPIWIVDRHDVLADKPKLCQSLLPRCRGDVRAFTLFDAAAGTAESLFGRLRLKLVPVQLRPPVLFRISSRTGIPRKGTARDFPDGICSLWRNLDAVPYLAKARARLFTWDELPGLTIPFHLVYPREGEKTEFLSSEQVRINRFEEGLVPENIDLGTDLKEVEHWLKGIYADKLLRERNEFFRPPGSEWNEDRIRFTEWRETPGYMFEFNAQKVPYLWFASTNIELGHEVDQLTQGGKIDPPRLRPLHTIVDENGGLEWLADFQKCWWFGNAVGESVLLIDDDGRALLSRRSRKLEQHAGWYQASGSGTTDYFADMMTRNRIDIVRSAYRELAYETGIRVRYDDIRCVGWGIDATHGHPNFLFFARSPQRIQTAKIPELFREESYETDHFVLVDLFDSDHVKGFLQSTVMSSNNVTLLILAHKWANTRTRGHVWDGIIEERPRVP